MSNDPTPEAVDDLKLEAALVFADEMTVVKSGLPSAVLAAAVRDLRTKLAEAKAALADSEYRRVKEGSELATIRQQLAEANAAREKETDDLLKNGNTLADSLTKALETCRQLRAENESLNGMLKSCEDACDQNVGEATQLRAALTSQQEAMDTAVRALEKAREYVSSERELIGLDEGEEVAESSDASIALRSIDAALAQLRASRASQFPESGKENLGPPLCNHCGAQRPATMDMCPHCGLTNVWVRLKLDATAQPTAKTDGEAKT